MSPSPRAVVLAVLAALSLLAVPWRVVLLVVAAGVVLVVIDALAARRPVTVARNMPERLARGVPAPLTVTVANTAGRRVTVRQARVADVAVSPSEAEGHLEATVVASRRGSHVLPPVAVRVTGPLGLGRWDSTAGGDQRVEVDPDLPAARRLATSVRQARFRDPGLRRRGAIGLGTDFDLVREYQPDDDVRHINWVASLRQQRAMTNQYREDTERDVVALVDCGRLMAAPIIDPRSATGARTRLDLAVDAAVALAAVADVVGDRCGALAYDHEIRARVAPRRASGRDVVEALRALEPRSVDSDAERAFRLVATKKRALVLVLTDLLDPAAATALLEAVPVLVRRHVVVVASVTDPDITLAGASDDARRAAVAASMATARDRAAAAVRHRGAKVIEARPEHLSAAVVAAYLDAKATARL